MKTQKYLSLLGIFGQQQTKTKLNETVQIFHYFSAECPVVGIINFEFFEPFFRVSQKN